MIKRLERTAGCGGSISRYDTLHQANGRIVIYQLPFSAAGANSVFRPPGTVQLDAVLGRMGDVSQPARGQTYWSDRSRPATAAGGERRETGDVGAGYDKPTGIPDCRGPSPITRNAQAGPPVRAIRISGPIPRRGLNGLWWLPENVRGPRPAGPQQRPRRRFSSTR